MRRRALLAASGGDELADFYLTLNTTNSENLKVYELFERECTLMGNLWVWEPTNINVYVSGQAGEATFSNARVTYASRFTVSRTWDVIFEGMDNIGNYPVCWLSDDGAVSAYDDD